MGKRIKIIISSVCFLLTILLLFVWITNVYRPSKMYERTHIMAFDKYKNFDVVCIGASEIFKYWEPMEAWNNFGITSYNYAVDGLDGANVEYMIKNVEDKMHPDLYIVGVRAYQLWDKEKTDLIRYVTDSWSITNPYRYMLISNYFNKHDVKDKVDYLSYWFDIAYYHENSDALKTPLSWQYYKRYDATNLGWEWLDAYQFLEEPMGWQTTEREPLVEGAEESLRELCDYCKNNNINVLFVVTPYYIKKEDERFFNTVEDIVSEYGYGFQNANEYNKDIGIDFSSDFYNLRHVNCFGAEKYTAFLGKYIKDKYNLKDHRGESGFESWDKDYEKFAVEEERHKNAIENLKSDVLKGFDLARQLRTYNSISDWFMATEDKRYTLFVYNNGLEYGENDELDRICKKWGINTNAKTCNVISGGEIKETNTIDDNMHMEGIVGQDSPYGGVTYNISKDHITIGDKDYYVNEDGLIVVAVDNPLWIIADSMILKSFGDSYSIIR